MEPGDALKNALALVEVSRRWVSVMDAKAAFISAMNAALLGFVWAAAKLPMACASRPAALAATACSMLSLLAAVWIILPRSGRKQGPNNEVKPVSFYHHVASFPTATAFREEFAKLSIEDLTVEALNQHWAISKVVRKKQSATRFAGIALLVAVMCTAVSIAVSSNL